MSIVYISTIGIIISAIDIFFFLIVMPVAISSELLDFNIISIEYEILTFTIGIVIDIILLVKYYRTKPIN